ncbi:hypothetical protein AB0M43_35455 [Longispora sp. NPDC051575]|uniref:hypothetical protein n=1 Tax=Longispora sp. NPDC051575 TaxID=3154943 RepID=UPI00341F8C6B
MTVKLSGDRPLIGPVSLDGRNGKGRTTGLVLLALALLAAWLWPASEQSDRPSSLSRTELVGPRGPACVRVVVGLDISGSMTLFAKPRDAALEQLLTWVRQPRTLRDNDEVAVVEFAFDAGVRQSATAVTALPAPLQATHVSDGADTLLEPLLTATSALSPTRCDVALVLISDAQLADLPISPVVGRDRLNRHGVHDLRLLAPGRSIDVPGQWATGFPEAAPTRFDGANAEETALAFGRTIADLTHQTLRRRTI